MTVILIVEDQPMNLKLVETILKANNFEFRSADSGQAAVEAARNEMVDLILMDLQMPDIDGFEAMASIRELPDYASVPIVAVSGNTTEADIARAEKAGFNGFVKKPFRIDELIGTINAALDASAN